MASDRQIAANRRNAANSRGPRTRAGKERSRQNAYRHGLAARLIAPADAAKQRAELARAIADGSDSVLVIDRARSAAEATLDLARAQRAKVAPLRILAGQDAPIKPAARIPGARPQMSEPMTVADALAELAAIDRYERRALSRRTRALQWIAQAKLQRLK
jgi:hypothetical protein